MVIGGIAVIARGVRRMTTDIDVTVKGDQADVGALLRSLAKKKIVPRIADAERFASESLVLLLRHSPTGVDFDVSMAWTNFEHAAIAASSIVEFGTVQAPMASAEDLIVFKAIAGRPKDIEDATALLVLYPKLDRKRLRSRVRQLAALAEEPELVRGLDEAIDVSGAQQVPARQLKSSPTLKTRPRTTSGAAPRRRAK